jgi:DNA repair exonuclease SbcCD ATPase subunit
MDIVQTTFDYAGLDEAKRVRVQVKAESIKARMKRTAEDIIAIGLDLIAVKGELGHGQFLQWIKAEFGMSDRHARNFMAVATRFSNKSEIISDLSPTILYELAAPSTPDEVIQEVLSGDLPANLEAIKIGKEAVMLASRIHEAEEKAKRLEEEARLTLARANEAEQKAKDATAQLSIFQAHSQLSQDKINELTKQIEDLQEQLDTMSIPEKVEVVPQSALDDMELMKSQIAKLTEQKKLLSDETKKYSEELRAERKANEAVRNQERYEAQVKDKWRNATDALYKSLTQFIGQIPSSIDLQIFDGEDWARYTQIEGAIKHFMEIFMELKRARYSQVVDNVYDTSLVTIGE